MTICSALQSWVEEVWQYLASKSCLFKKQGNSNDTGLRVFLSGKRSRSFDSLVVWSVNEKVAFWGIIQEHISHLLKNTDHHGSPNYISISSDLIDFDQLDSLNSDDLERCRQLTGKELWDGHYVTAVHIYRRMSLVFAETFLIDLQVVASADLAHQRDLFELKKIFLDNEKL